MSASKGLSRWGALLKLEPTYGTDSTPTAGTDSVLVIERPDWDIDYVHDGARNGAPGTGAPHQRAAKTGRFGTIPLVHEAAGAGVAYSATIVPSFHTLLRICGFNAAVTTVAGSEKWVYTPGVVGVDTMASATLGAYQRGETAKLTGVYGELSIEGEAGGIPKWSIGTQGIMPALPTDAALPAMAYAGAQLVMPAKAEALVLTIGNFVALRVRSFSLKQERGLTARGLDNSTGNHGGFQPAMQRKHTLECVVEATPLATGTPYHTATQFNPYWLDELGTALSLSLTVGSSQYRRWKIGAPAGQLNRDNSDTDNIAEWTLSFDLTPSTLGGSDDVSITAD